MSSLKFEHWREDKVDRFKAVAFDGGIDGWLGVRTVDIRPGVLVAAFDVRPDMITVMGNLHGGCLAAFCDHCLGFVLYPVMPKGSWAATTEFKINYLAPVTGGTCTATTTVVSMTSKTAVVRIDVDNGDRPVAMAQGTCLIMAPRASGTST